MQCSLSMLAVSYPPTSPPVPHLHRCRTEHPVTSRSPVASHPCERVAGRPHEWDDGNLLAAATLVHAGWHRGGGCCRSLCRCFDGRVVLLRVSLTLSATPHPAAASAVDMAFIVRAPRARAYRADFDGLAWRKCRSTSPVCSPVSNHGCIHPRKGGRRDVSVSERPPSPPPPHPFPKGWCLISSLTTTQRAFYIPSDYATPPVGRGTDASRNSLDS